MPAFSSLTSVTRWLLVVAAVGAILEMVPTVQAADAAAASDLPAQALLYPGGPDARPSDPTLIPRPLPAAGGGWLTALGCITALGGVAWWLQRRRLAGPGSAGRAARIEVEASRSLGGRQYLMIARVDGRRLLLGVTTERIQHLTDLDDVESEDAATKRSPGGDS
jgi:hypothetical protein